MATHRPLQRRAPLVCVSDEARMREVAGDHQAVVVHDLRTDKAAMRWVAEPGIRAARAVVLDGRLPGCCNHAGPDRHELVAVGASQPPG